MCVHEVLTVLITTYCTCTKEVLYTVVQKRYYIQLYKRGTIYSCTKEVLYTVSTDVPRHLKHFKVGGAGCQFPLLQSSPLAGLSYSLPLACLSLSHCHIFLLSHPSILLSFHPHLSMTGHLSPPSLEVGSLYSFSSLSPT